MKERQSDRLLNQPTQHIRHIRDDAIHAQRDKALHLGRVIHRPHVDAQPARMAPLDQPLVRHLGIRVTRLVRREWRQPRTAKLGRQVVGNQQPGGNIARARPDAAQRERVERGYECGAERDVDGGGEHEHGGDGCDG